MIFPFYNNDEKAYTINDANYWCWRIIVADCDMWHKYATLCELVADCPEMKQLTRPCIVNALNDLRNLPWTNSLSSNKWFLRVTTDGCLEVADPCICNDWDRYVAATDNDNSPWTLDKKVRGSCSFDWLYCIDIEEAWPSLLVWRPSGPNGPFINPSMPSGQCPEWEYYVKLKWSTWHWTVDYECEQTNKPQYAKCIYLAWPGMAATSAQNRTVRYVVPWANSAYKPVDTWSDDANSYIDWDWSVVWTDAFAKPKTNGVITITKAWVYEVAFSTYITFWQVLHSIRCGIYADSWSWMHEINDIKYQCWEYWSATNDDWGRPHISDVTINRLWPEEWDQEKYTKNADYGGSWWVGRTLDNTWLPFARTYIINVSQPTELFMVVKPDMRWVDPRLDPDVDREDRYRIAVSWASDWNPYWASTTIEIARLSDVVLSDRLKPLS